jgi:hypothetical protein
MISTTIFYFPEEYHKKLDHDENIEFLDQTKTRDPEWQGTKQWLIPTLKFLKFVMRNMSLTSRV